MKISEAVITGIVADITDMLEVNQADMDLAYLAAGDDPLGIAIKVNIAPDESKVKFVTTINFVKDRCKDERKSWVDEEQINLFEEGGETDGV